jgi:hypothetical protein
MRRGTRDAAWGLLVLTTATGCASASAEAGAGPVNHDGYTGAFNNGYWGDDGAQAKDERIQEPG